MLEGNLLPSLRVFRQELHLLAKILHGQYQVPPTQSTKNSATNMSNKDDETILVNKFRGRHEGYVTTWRDRIEIALDEMQGVETFRIPERREQRKLLSPRSEIHRSASSAPRKSISSILDTRRSVRYLGLLY